MLLFLYFSFKWKLFKIISFAEKTDPTGKLNIRRISKVRNKKWWAGNLFK